MQSYENNRPIGLPEMVSRDGEEFRRRVDELLNEGADEVRVFEASNAQLNARLKEKGMNRAQRRNWIKTHRDNRTD